MKKKGRQGYIGGACDPNKAVNCSKEHCSYVKDKNGKPKGTCNSTTNPNWIKEGYYDDNAN